MRVAENKKKKDTVCEFCLKKQRELALYIEEFCKGGTDFKRTNDYRLCEHCNIKTEKCQSARSKLYQEHREEKLKEIKERKERQERSFVFKAKKLLLFYFSYFRR